MAMEMPIQCLDVQSWRVFSDEEIRNYLKKLQDKISNRTRRKPTGSALVVRSEIKPVDIYSYLKARFGNPNGFQTFLRKDDSDNLFHWDYNIKASGADIYIVGGTRETHFYLSENLTDDDWKALIRTIKKDFGRVGLQKSRVLKSFEKWLVFQNKFAVLADVCADLHEKIVDAPPFESYKASGRTARQFNASAKVAKRMSARSKDLYAASLNLRLVTPIMAEAFLNLFILAFCKRKIREQTALYGNFVRQKIPQKLEMLYEHCNFMEREIDTKSLSYKNFMRMINKRNNLIHGNMDPEQDVLEVAYFEGKRPLLVNSGDHIGQFFEKLEQINDPRDIITDYENTHLFLQDILMCLNVRARDYFMNVMSDNFPGYEVNQKRITRLFPDHVFSGTVHGLKFDDELEVDWSSA